MKGLTAFALILTGAYAATISSINTKVEANGRITAGEDAEVDDFPYQVDLYIGRNNKKGLWLCGGSIIGNEWVLTAAHCMKDVREVTVFLGSLIRGESKVEYKRTPEDVIAHPDYHNFENDIALIKIPPTNFSSSINAVKLPNLASSYPSYANEEAIVSGWGRVSDKSLTLSTVLQWAVVEIMENDECITAQHREIPASNICIATGDGVSTCRGDSGGPLVLASTNEQIGIDSFNTKSECQVGNPVTFTRVTSFLEWIKDNTGISY